eukprot:s1286_g18.t2
MAALAAPAALAAAAANEAASVSQQPLDVEFAMTMRQVEVALSMVSDRHMRIRGEQWAQRLGLLAKLRQPLFQKDRNLHADLLLKCIQDNHWSEPMDKHPPEGPLPSLPRHVACALRRTRLERRQLGGAVSVSPRLPQRREEGVQTEGGPTSQSLAHAAATAVKPATNLGGYGYSRALAARLARLELQNKQLRKQLDAVVQRSRSTSPGRSPGTGTLHRARSRETLPGSPTMARPRSPATVRPAVVTPKMAEMEPSTLVSHAEVPADTEAFLKYLDVFQAQARSLIRLNAE